MRQKNEKIFAKVIIGMYMPVFLSILVPQISLAQQVAPETSKRVSAFSITTTDPYFTTDSMAADKQWYLSKLKVPDAWYYTKGSSNVIVAIVDTGIHASHLELNDGRVIDGFNAITNQPIPANSDSDDNGHGTAVAGVIGAIPNNALGISGIDWNIQLMPIKALAADGTGDLSAVVAGIIWATDHGANIINLSMGGIGFGADKSLSNAISYAYYHGVLIVAAAGNDLADQGLNMDISPVYPICADNGQNMILGVAATDINDKKADFSNFGHNCVDISAPGEHILTTGFLPNNPTDNVLLYGSGTSLATPMVSGVAALLKSSNPNLSNVDIQNLLIKSADNIDSLNQTSCLNGSCNGFLGSGRLDALAAITPQPIANATLVRESTTGSIYIVIDNTKKLISNFVFNQRGFSPASVLTEVGRQLDNYPTGTPLPPLDGTLVKSNDDPEVFVFADGLKHAVTYLVFTSRGYNFADIKVVNQTELNSYAEGGWYWPPDGTLILVSGNPLIYVMDKQVRRPVTYFVFTQRHLSFSKVISISANEFTHVPAAPDSNWLPPLDGTLVKSDSDPGIYLINSGTKELLSLSAFQSRGYKFGSVKELPQVEIDVIAPGMPLL